RAPLIKKHVNCPTQLCNYAGCPDRPQESLRCVVESCGKCSVKFITRQQDRLSCVAQRILYVSACSLVPRGKPLLLGQYIPTCDAEWTF
ncbi:hypothetical protein OS493_026976, partial [Desmophyllum pertusum]